MSTFQSLEEAQAFFTQDRFATENGMTLDELGEGYAVCSVVLTSRHRNAYGGVMGGVIFTLADYAFAAASNNIHKVTVAMQVSINYLSAPKGEKLIATAKCIKDGKTSMVVNVDIADDTGRAVAQFVGTGFKL
ncbi:MAG: PaaI family thioesterase [Lachnospiraceae bacterium]|nr:PaaI family thioesterase [Lachnospiraceae bacterium]